MFNPTKIFMTLMIMGGSLLQAATPQQPAPFVPLLPNDTPEQVAFTRESIEQLISAPKLAPAAVPELAASPVPGRPSYAAEIAAAAEYLLGIKKAAGTSYLEGSPGAGSGIGGWEFLSGDATVARSKIGEIGLGLLAAYRHYPTASLKSAIEEIASDLYDDYKNNSGPLAGHEGLPFMADVVFMLKYDEQASAGYLEIVSGIADEAETLFGNVGSAADEVDRIYGVRSAQGVPELTGYDVALIVMAANELNDNGYAESAAAQLLGKSWEASFPQDNTNNVLSRGAMLAAGEDQGSPTSWADFLVGIQRSGDGNYNSINSDGSFLPAGNIYSNSWAILGLKEAAGASNATYNDAAVAGCMYLVASQGAGGSWLTYPLFNEENQWFYNHTYPFEVGAALSALGNTSYVLRFAGVTDRENNYIEDLPVWISDGTDDITDYTDASGDVLFPALLVDDITATFPLSASDLDHLRGEIIGATDASLVLEQVLEDTPFSEDDLGTPGYGTAAYALEAANLTLSPTFTSANVNSQIASEILAFSVDNPPLVLTAAEFAFIKQGSVDDYMDVSHSSKYDQAQDNYSAILVLTGDISNNLTDAGLPGAPALMLASAGKISPMKLSLNNFMLEEGKLLLPVALSELGTGIQAPKAFQFELTYDAQTLTYSGLRLAEMTGGFLYAENSSEPGLVRVAMASGIAIPANGIIAYLTFELKKEDAGLKSFSLGKILIDEVRANSETGNIISESTLNAAVGIALPKAFNLFQNDPNPFNPSTTISYNIPEASRPVNVELRVFNLRGQLVKTLVDAQQPAGSYTVHWNGQDKKGQIVSSGIYFYRIQAGDYFKTRKMIIIK